MAAPRTVVTPGDSTPNETPTEAVSASETQEPKPVPVLNGTNDQQMAALMAQFAEMKAKLDDVSAQNVQLSRQINRNVPSAAEPVKLPSVDEAKAMNADAPVMTKDGWHVPAVTTANPVQRRGI